MAKSVAIEGKNLHKTFEVGNQKIEVLRGIDFQIHSGEYVIFFGPSGCGKSTLLNVISGLEPPSEGELLVRGDPIYKESQKKLTEYRRSKIGIVFQSFNLLKSLTIQENVALPMAAGGEPYKRRMDRAMHLLSMVGLDKFAKRIPAEISGGQQQRVAIARALSVNPWIMICDEPTGNLDSKSAEEVMEIIGRLNSKSKRTVILVTHNPDYLKYPHRVLFFKDGQIVKEQVNRNVESPEKEDHEDVDMKDIIHKDEEPEEKAKDNKEKKK